MIELTEIIATLSEGKDETSCVAVCKRAAIRLLGLSDNDIRAVSLHRKSVDARKTRDVHFILSAHLLLEPTIDEHALISSCDNRTRKRLRVISDEEPSFPDPKSYTVQHSRPVVVGAGCAGLFAALTLAEAGLEPLLIERGTDAMRRGESIARFNATGKLDPESNIQFGLGGAGTFSDGKLTTGTKNPLHRLILETFVQAGAPREILWDAKPHIGSDILPRVVTALVDRIRLRGGEVRFGSRLIDIHRDVNGAIRAIEVEDTASGKEKEVETGHLILACGHSARDVFELLRRRGFALARKTFAMGVRIEHLQIDIDHAQYGSAAGHPSLGASPYKLVAHLPSGRSVFSFCMCPGGQVVAAASERGGVVTNGASLYARDGRNANSALLVNITPQDLPGTDPLAGIALQRACEQCAYELGGGNYRAPAQLVGDFLMGRPSAGPQKIEPTYPRGVTWTDISPCLPEHVARTLREGIPVLGRKLHGFDDPQAVLTAVESRSSSPITVLRDKTCHAEGVRGLYPCGEGAGYAGGIMSAATDGIRCAQALIEDLS